ncbi:hypothetical protein DERP_007565 [Dermatophagoides pteronyssinus]|uniref:Uncharacterized protein n=1 Tax=Dermatophagoides pteronyssinus TaxID=6956 RepID=A0ABQ8JK37_DERPT|nr:hypothetical protein DERP_007565 [Dermatophagoides pteronyssinus]
MNAYEIDQIVSVVGSSNDFQFYQFIICIIHHQGDEFLHFCYPIESFNLSVMMGWPSLLYYE